MSVANNISFSNFCHLCTKIKAAPKDKKLDILRLYIDNWKKKGKELNQNNGPLDDSFFAVLRLLVPQLDRERGAYGVKEVTLARIYIRILSLPKDGRDAIKLLDFRAPKTSKYESCDFAEVAYWILKSRCAEGGKLSIEDINKHLDGIASSHAVNEARGVDSELVSLLTATSAEEQKWLIRILLKDVKLGLSQYGILNCYHPDSKELYEATNNLKKVCDLLKNPESRLNEIEVELFAPFKPMLSEECDITKISSYFDKTKRFFIETKLDGERFQIHMKEGNYKYFSRNGFDYTSNFGSTFHEGVLTPQIAKQLNSNVESCILDGEMMIWNKKNQSFGTKANSVDVKSLKEFDTYQPCFCAFDILYYNGEVLTNKPLGERSEILRKVIRPLESVIIFVNQKMITSADEVIDGLNDAIDNREEGIVLKDVLSVYKPNIRRQGGWFKIKPEYAGGLSDTLDLLIIGGYYGGRKNYGSKGNISHFLLGVAVDTIENQKLFYSTAKVGSGYSMNELEVLLSKLQSHWKIPEPGIMPPNIEWAKEMPDVWIEPENSYVLEIKAAEIIYSNLFKSGYSLRFPRVERIRYDKSWNDTLTFEELITKHKAGSGKLATTHFLPIVDKNLIPKKKKKMSTFRIQNKAQDISNVHLVSNLLMGKEICVFGGFDGHDKYDIEKKILEYGGKIVKNPGKNTFCILAENDSTTRIKNAIRCGSHDIIISSWFFSQLQIDHDELPELKPNHFLALSSQRKRFFSESYDEFGDHYTQPASRDTISYPMMVAKRKADTYILSSEEKREMDAELYGDGKTNPYGIFRDCLAYFDCFSIVSNPSSESLTHLINYQIDFRFRGGHCTAAITKDTTHVVVFSGDLSRLKNIKKVNEERKMKFDIVNEKWIQASIKNGAISTESGF